jgi:predicted house-cleaning noncanonical NTP pyrophosphatase (MazG superfamily)
MSLENLYILSPHFGEQQANKNISEDFIGQKAIGLLETPPSLVPPFIVISSHLFNVWHRENQEKAGQILRDILDVILTKFNKFSIDKFIVRSSAKYESFDEKGYYSSSPGGIASKDLEEIIYETWFKNVANVERFKDNQFAIIIQQFEKPFLTGHVSNERRISRNTNKFLYEIVSSSGNIKTGKISKKAINLSTDINDGIRYNSRKSITDALESLCTFLASDKKRHHVEWVCDKEKLWIVQNDIEKEVEGSPPGSSFVKQKKSIEHRVLKSFSQLESVSSEWHKIKCLQTFKECDLPIGTIFILENPELLSVLSNGRTTPELEEDLDWLLEYPLVIRMDRKKGISGNNLMLPRTETLYDKNSVIKFLVEHSKKFISNGLTETDFCFLLHRYINAKACALAFSKPQIPKVRIDSTWGIVDGLYYYPHDSFEINLVDNSVKKKIRCKTEYLDIDEKGKWVSKRAGRQWDWAESLSQKQLLDIAHYNSIVSQKINHPVTVMYFVGVDTSTDYPSILPWFYTTDEIASNSEKFTDIIFSENREILQNEQDFEKLKLKLQGQEREKFIIKLKLTVEILRYKEFIEDVGKYAFENNIPIELQGSILSHTYYILRKTGAKVKCVDPFNPVYGKQEFYKLVRDKIPVNIQTKGEKTTTVNIDSHLLLNFLKEKAVEEALEFFWETDKDKIIEEMADVFEVLKSACSIFGTSITEIEKIAEIKNANKGGFETGLLLLDTSEASLIESVDLNAKSTNKKTPTIKSIKNKREKFKIHTNVSENSISLPYIFGGFEQNTNSRQLKFSIELDGRQVEIIYSSGGIKLILNKDKPVADPSQGLLF